MANQIFIEISILISIALAISIVMRVIKQPLIIGYIITGIVVGPAVTNLINEPQTIETFGKFGIVLLLFIVGIGLNVNTIKELGRASLITGLGQVALTTLAGYFVVSSFGFSVISSIYIALGLALSSTIVILKLISDKKEQGRLHGRIAIGILLVQDIIATFALMAATASTNGGIGFSDLMSLLVKGILVVATVLVVSRVFVKPMTKFFEHSKELLFLFTIAWGLGIAALFYWLGFSLEVGALFAGVSIASMSYAQDVSSRLRPLRDFFIVVFFISLGASLRLESIGSIWWQAIALSGFVIIVKPVIILAILGLMGYKKRTGFNVAVSMGQVSEFSLIFVLMGVSNGQLSQNGVVLVTLVALVTFATSSYQIIYSEKIYKFLEKYLSLFERKKTANTLVHSEKYDAIIFGYKKGGLEFANALNKMGIKSLIVDHDPDAVDEASRRGLDYVYGDATNYDLLEEIDFTQVKSVISTITDQDSTEFIVSNAFKANPKMLIICSADSAVDASKLYENGATYVMMPHTIGTEKISNFIAKHGLEKSKFKSYRDKHLVYISNSIEETPKKESIKIGHAVINKMADLAKMPIKD